MNRGILFRILCCIVTVGFFLYAYIAKQNSITELRLSIPIISKEVQELLQENICLQFEIDQFHSPEHLMELARQPQFSYLKHPRQDEIIVVEVK